MAIEIKVPALPESVTDAVVAKWYKKEGDSISRDENLVDLETDKVMLEVPAPKDGIISKILVQEGDTVTAEQLLAELSEGADRQPEPTSVVDAAKPQPEEQQQSSTSSSSVSATPHSDAVGPAARRAAAEKHVDINQVVGSGKGGRVTKQDVQAHVLQSPSTSSTPETVATMGSRTEKRVPMSRIRQRIAERLKQVQHEAAILTTFNEINMQPVMDLRKAYKDQFEKAHSVRLGFMSFFTKAAVEALKRFPMVNASIDEGDVIYHNYCDIGIAIGTERGLVVPILRNVENFSMADIEKEIRRYAELAQTGKLAIEDLTGGTFSITNGGTYGSMMSTPIINPPQSAILGMHNITQRPVAENGEVVIRPMMYVALSYDHRIVDGREAVLFLSSIKQMLEEPARMLLEV